MSTACTSPRLLALGGCKCPRLPARDTLSFTILPRCFHLLLLCADVRFICTHQFITPLIRKALKAARIAAKVADEEARRLLALQQVCLSHNRAAR